MHRIPPRRVALADGATLLLRPVRRTDGPAFLEMFDALSPESIYHRFLAPLSRMDEPHLRRYVDVDQASEVAIGAWLRDWRRWRLVGVARYHVNAPPAAEMAVVVGDPWHRRRIGQALVGWLAAVARARGIGRFVSPVDPSNRALIRLVRSCGFAPESHYDHDSGLLRLEMAITDAVTSGWPPP
jgi:GNAT superfamily N-acetyltransferase